MSDNDSQQLTWSRLAQTARMCVRAETAAALAHDVNQPLAAIANYVSICQTLLNSPRPDCGELPDLLARIDQQVRRAADLMHDRQQWIAAIAPQPADTDLGSLVSQVSRLMVSGVRAARAKLVVRVVHDLPRVHVDAAQIQLVLTSLIQNALDALGGVPPARRCVQLEAAAGTDAVEITVSDHGCGLSSVAMKHLFESHDSSKPDGLGLSLAISRRIVEAHGGRIGASPHRGGGAQFRLSLPIDS